MRRSSLHHVLSIQEESAPCRRRRGKQRSMEKVGFIGTGTIGSAILKALMKSWNKDNLTYTDVNPKAMQKVYEETGIKGCGSGAACVVKSKYIVLAVKPQFYDSVLDEIRDVITDDNIIISLAPGVSIGSVSRHLKGHKRIVRCMPNTPALLGEGMTGVCYDKTLFTDREQATIRKFFESFGKMELLPEDLLNAVTCVSGSAPAYIYMFIEALADAGVKYGMPRKVAYRMAAQAVVGSAKMVLETGKHPGELKDDVCSPGGTTIYAVAMLEEYGLRNAVIRASDACYEKCVDLMPKEEE